MGLPRIAHGRGRKPPHVHYVFHELDDGYRLELVDEAHLWQRLGFPRSVRCADRAAYDRQLEALLAARVPFMIGHVIPGPSDAVYFWQKERGDPVGYLEIAVGGPAEWTVKEIVEGATEWRKVPLRELLGAGAGAGPAGRSARRTRRRRGRALAVVALLFALAIAAATAWRRSAPPADAEATSGVPVEGGR